MRSPPILMAGFAPGRDWGSMGLGEPEKGKWEEGIGRSERGGLLFWDFGSRLREGESGARHAETRNWCRRAREWKGHQTKGQEGGDDSVSGGTVPFFLSPHFTFAFQPLIFLCHTHTTNYPYPYSNNFIYYFDIYFGFWLNLKIIFFLLLDVVLEIF